MAVVQHLALGVLVASVLGAAGGFGLAYAFRRGKVPEFMKVPVLFVTLLGVFALSDRVLHESGLLAVTIMGIVIANANLPSYEELRRFKEHATVLLVSGVFILLAAGLDFAELARLDWRAVVFVLVVVLVVRPLTVMISLLGTGLPWAERWLIALTGPRGVVLVAVAGLFGERLTALGIADGALIGPLAFVLVVATVVLHGFTLTPFARFLGLTGGEKPGLLLVGGSRWSTAFAAILKQAEVPVLMTDPNHGHLRPARGQGIPTFYGDILSEAAEQNIELVSYATLVAATDNDPYNTLVATDLAPEFGRENVYQLTREKESRARHALPSTLGGRAFAQGKTYAEFEGLIRDGWEFRLTRLTAAYTLEHWRAEMTDALLVLVIQPSGDLRLPFKGDSLKGAEGMRLVYMVPPGTGRGEDAPQARTADDPVPAGPSTAAAAD